MGETTRPAADQNDSSIARDDQPLAPGKGLKRGFPAPVTILTLVLIVVWVAAFFIPSGQYKVDVGGSPVAGSFKYVPSRHRQVKRALS
jgi:uncharacterized ion transporter superfamily protein YfcC